LSYLNCCLRGKREKKKGYIEKRPRPLGGGGELLSQSPFGNTNKKALMPLLRKEEREEKKIIPKHHPMSIDGKEGKEKRKRDHPKDPSSV